MITEYPVLEPLLIVTEREVPVLGRLLDKSVSRVVFVCRIDELLRRKRSATLLTLVSVSAFSTTSRASTHDITVSKEFSRHLVAILLFGDFLKLAVVIELAEEVRCKLMVYLACGARVDIK